MTNDLSDLNVPHRLLLGRCHRSFLRVDAKRTAARKPVLRWRPDETSG